MRPQLLTCIALTLLLTGRAIGQRADIEIGVLTCTLDPPGTTGPTVESQLRDAVCVFKPKSGTEESYGGQLQGVSLSPDKTTTVIWIVKADTVMPSVPGLLQQSYALDPATPADHLGPLVGETNSRIILQSMTDKREGSASAAQKPPPTGYVITGLQLKLKSASG